MNIRYCFAILALALVATDLSAQAGRRRTAPRPDPAARGAAVRAELAAVLLEAGKYTEAAREYRRLVQANGRNFAYRLGLARALAWGERYRDAEKELRVLASQRPDDPDVEKLKELVRNSLAPTSTEARFWVLERPDYHPYRLSFARALLRERQTRPSLDQYEIVMAVAPSAALLREIGEAYASTGDLPGGIAYAQGTVLRAPADTGYRRALEDLLVSDRKYAEAVAQSDTIVMLARTPGTLTARARTHAARGDLGAAERDLRESIAIAPTAEAFVLLGDTYRWRGAFGRAREAYENAGKVKPDTSLTAAFAQLARDERAVLALEPEPVASQDWQTAAEITSDNAGVQYSTLAFRRSFDLAGGFVGGAKVEGRQLRESNAPVTGTISGYAADLEVAREGTRGAVYGRAEMSAGLAIHPQAQAVATGSMVLTARYYAWSVSYDMSTRPAYPLLRTLASVVPLGVGTTPLRVMTRGGSLGGPLGRADIALGLRRGAITDGNRRTEFQGYGRLPLTSTLSAVYWGSALAFAEPSAQYWSPRNYLANSLGLELATRQLRGWSVIVRALPGVASTDETPFSVSATPDTTSRRPRFQMNAGGELGYRHPRWESAIAFGWGKVATYTRTEASLRITLNR